MEDRLVAIIVALLAVLLVAAMATAIFLLRRSERKRSFDERRYALVESLPDAFFIVDDDWCFTHVNERAEALLRHDVLDLIGQRIDRVLDPLASELFPEMVRARKSGKPIEFVQTFESTGQSVEVRIQPSESEMLVYLRDVTERRNSEKRLRDGERRLRLLLQQVPAVLWTADMDMRLTSASGTTLADYALRESEIVGKPVDEVFSECERSADMHAQIKRVFAGESLRYETARNGRWLQHDIEPLRSSDGTIVGAIGAALDITEMKHSSARLKQQARIDALTSLPNRLALEEQLSAMLAEAKSERRTMAVMFLDLDRFKVINDSLGHRAGDDVLCVISERLAGLLEGRARVFRPGGDEFVILTEGAIDSAGIAKMATEILDSFAAPVIFEGRELMVTASIGASLFPDNAFDASELIKQADAAMYRAKDAGRRNAQFYSGAMHARILESMSLELDLRQALARGELAVLYQPIVELETEKLIGAEALLRWNHPLLGEIEPARFIGIAEEVGVITEITAWVLKKACLHAAAMRRIGLSRFRIAVNVSVRDLCEPAIHERIATALQEAGLTPDVLDLEITEGITLDDVAVKALALIERTGVRVVVDDFGIGYSSLEYIKRLPVGAIKIDKSFVADIVHDAHDQAIVKAIATIGESLGLGVVAEGIETSAQRDFLIGARATTAQGFYFSRPISETQFTQLVRALPKYSVEAQSSRVVSLFR
jgi:diguanylate cyclase (GGDEF)-like protein/PAS domain S-box-containing protein